MAQKRTLSFARMLVLFSPAPKNRAERPTRNRCISCQIEGLLFVWMIYLWTYSISSSNNSTYLIPHAQPRRIPKKFEEGQRTSHVTTTTIYLVAMHAHKLTTVTIFPLIFIYLSTVLLIVELLAIAAPLPFECFTFSLTSLDEGGRCNTRDRSNPWCISLSCIMWRRLQSKEWRSVDFSVENPPASDSFLQQFCFVSHTYLNPFRTPLSQR